MNRYQRRGGPWFVLAAAVLWGTTGTAQALAPESARPAIIGAVRLAIGGTALLALAAGRGVLRREGRWPIMATAFAAASMAAYQLCFFAAVARTGVAVGTVVTIGSAPILASILGFLIRQERPGQRWLVATAAAYVLFARGLITVSVATAVTLALAEPLTAGMLGVLLLGERLTSLALVGVGLILAGLALLTLGARLSRRHQGI